MLAIYEVHRLASMRALFQRITSRKQLTPQQKLLCEYVVHYITYQKRVVDRALFSSFAKLQCLKTLLKYIRSTETDPTYDRIQHVRRDSIPILEAMKRYGVEYLEYYYLAGFFTAVFKGEVEPFDPYTLGPQVNVKFWLETRVRVSIGNELEWRGFEERNVVQTKVEEHGDNAGWRPPPHRAQTFPVPQPGQPDGAKPNPSGHWPLPCQPHAQAGPRSPPPRPPRPVSPHPIRLQRPQSPPQPRPLPVRPQRPKSPYLAPPPPVRPQRPKSPQQRYQPGAQQPSSPEKPPPMPHPLRTHPSVSSQHGKDESVGTIFRTVSKTFRG